MGLIAEDPANILGDAPCAFQIFNNFLWLSNKRVVSHCRDETIDESRGVVDERFVQTVQLLTLLFRIWSFSTLVGAQKIPHPSEMQDNIDLKSNNDRCTAKNMKTARRSSNCAPATKLVWKPKLRNRHGEGLTTRYPSLDELSASDDVRLWRWAPNRTVVTL